MPYFGKVYTILKRTPTNKPFLTAIKKKEQEQQQLQLQQQLRQFFVVFVNSFIYRATPPGG